MRLFPPDLVEKLSSQPDPRCLTLRGRKPSLQLVPSDLPMKTLEILKGLERRIWAVLTLRETVQWITAFFFGFGVVVLAVRMLTRWPTEFLVVGLVGIVPIAGFLAVRQWGQRPQRDQLRALMDQHNQAGGLIVAEGQADTGSWAEQLPELAVPEFRWRSRRPMMVFTCSAVFLAVTFLIPERHLGLAAKPSLEIGELVGEINEEIELLEEEKILDEEKAEDLQEQLDRLERDADANDPAKTWEALDHLKQANSDKASEAAEEALKKIEALKQSETLAGALNAMPEPNEAASTRGMQDLASMLEQAELEEGLLKGELPEDLLKNAKDAKLTPEQLKALLEAIRNNKDKLGECMKNLANLKLIDAKKLGQCNKAGQCPNPSALAAYLSKECKGTNSLCSAVVSFCRGGISRGRGDAPMTWQNPSDFDGTKSKDQALPMGSLAGMKDAQFVGISRSAPEVTGGKEDVTSGALSGAKAAGGSAQVRQVLPKHKGAVQRFFKREN